ncbi:glycoside hydrolase, partial [Gorgonomyces haynaldii]
MSDAQPIETVHDLLTWTKNPFQRCHLPKQKRQQRKQQVIHCHDYKNGYQEDKRPQGGTKECYHFQYLAYIDIFIYFSHHRITVPPLNWIQTLHRNGVQCLGTIITEWLPGIPETLELIYGPAFDHDLPSTQRDFSPVYADILVDIALYYGFDGWFINIECPLPNAIDVIILTRFLKYFEQQIKARIPEGQLMWYDSVIDTGELKWRDHLCKSNKMMFDVCDSIFINYTWKEGFPFASKIEAQDRNYDVFTGIDVWGRNSFGGGGFNCPIALEEIQEHTSIAIFAPAWTYEYLGPKQFERHDAKLWVDASLQVEWPEPFEETPSTFPRTDKAIADYVAPRQLATTEFHTHFCRGYGKDFYWFGQKHETGQWMHLSRQSLCPLK